MTFLEFKYVTTMSFGNRLFHNSFNSCYGRHIHKLFYQTVIASIYSDLLVQYVVEIVLYVVCTVCPLHSMSFVQ